MSITFKYIIMIQHAGPRRSSRKPRRRLGYNPYTCSPCGCEDNCQSTCTNRKGQIQCVTGYNCCYESCANRPFDQPVSYLELYPTGDRRGQGVRLTRKSGSHQFLGEFQGKPIKPGFKSKEVVVLHIFMSYLTIRLDFFPLQGWKADHRWIKE